MIKFTKQFVSIMILMATVAIISCSSCSSNEGPRQNGTNESYLCKMIFNITKTGFSDELNSRSSAQWENGDSIYLLFTSGDNLVYGDAVYSDGEWLVNYNGSLAKNTETTCRAFYFENTQMATHSTIGLNENTGIYEDLEGKYTLTDGSLSITATLKPKTGRIRFKGTNHDEIKVYGITHYTSFNRYTGEFSTSKGIIKSKVESEYTPYIYGTFTDSIEPRVNVWKSSEGFTRIFPSSIFKAGESGYVTIPTYAAHNGWQNNIILKINDVEFAMIPVKYSSGDFLIAQTETTEELYEAIMNDGQSSKLPKRGLYDSNWVSFTKSLSTAMELVFRRPSYYEWKYAFCGGNSTNKFTYSGSNDIAEVAWYKGNSNNTPHDVATKQPNELGLYDMSGNVFELVTNSVYSAYGGSYDVDQSYCREGSDKDLNNSNMQSIGLRIAMSNN